MDMSQIVRDVLLLMRERLEAVRIAIVEPSNRGSEWQNDDSVSEGPVA